MDNQTKPETEIDAAPAEPTAQPTEQPAQPPQPTEQLPQDGLPINIDTLGDAPLPHAPVAYGAPAGEYYPAPRQRRSGGKTAFIVFVCAAIAFSIIIITGAIAANVFYANDHDDSMYEDTIPSEQQPVETLLNCTINYFQIDAVRVMSPFYRNEIKRELTESYAERFEKEQLDFDADVTDERAFCNLFFGVLERIGLDLDSDYNFNECHIEHENYESIIYTPTAPEYAALLQEYIDSGFDTAGISGFARVSCELVYSRNQLDDLYDKYDYEQYGSYDISDVELTLNYITVCINDEWYVMKRI